MSAPTVYKVFVASPGDLRPEREALEGVINELNTSWNDAGIYLRLVKWERDVYPGFASDAQAVVNSELKDDYDIFIGLLWTRFGNPTPRAESGTQEEFDRAYARYEHDRNGVRLMIYFKDQPLAPSSIDTKQLEKVNLFRENVSKLGGLYGTFVDVLEFTKLMRIHLTKHILHSRIDLFKTPNIPLNSVRKPEHVEDARIVDQPTGTRIDGEGFLNLIEKSTENLDRSTVIAQELTSLMNAYTQKTTEKTLELNDIGAPTDKQQVRKVITIMDSYAEDMNVFSVQLDAKRHIYMETYSNGIEAVGKAVELLQDFGDRRNEITEMLGNVKNLRMTLSSLVQSVQGMRDSATKLPRVTTNFSRSKSKLLDTLHRFILDLESGLKLTVEVEQLVSGLIS